MIKNRRTLVALAIGATSLVGAGSVAAHDITRPSRSDREIGSAAPVNATAGFSGFDSPASGVDATPLIARAASRVGGVPSLSDVVAIGPVGADLGLLAFINDRGVACYAFRDLISRCYVPFTSDMPALERDLHFDVVAPEKVAPDGSINSWVIGLADDQVVSARVRIAGEWRELPLARNGLFLDLPGIPQSTIQVVEATLTDGSRESYNVQAPSG